MKSRILLLAGLILSLANLNIQNCEKWSLASEIMLLLTDTQSGLFTNILSIREAELLRTREGLSMVGDNSSEEIVESCD